MPLVADNEVEHHQPCVFLNVTLVSELHPSNAEEPMNVTLLGIVMLVSELHPLNVAESMIVTLLGIVMLVSELHPLNAPLFNPVRTPYKIAA